MKKIVLAVFLVFALSSVAMAAPLMDYSQGKGTLDYTYRPNVDFKGSTVWEEGPAFGSIDGKASMDLGLTVGLGKKFALQYRYYNPKTDTVSESYDWGDGYGFGASAYSQIKSHEFNVLYKLDKNVAAFAGIVRPTLSLHESYWWYGEGSGSESYRLDSETKTRAHIGLVGVTDVGDKTKAFGVVSVGNDYRNWELGLSYAVSKDWDFNVSYRHTKFDGFKFPQMEYDIADYGKTDVTVKGFGFGVTYKF